ncbi:hypothetical protein V6N13_146490 [Hibiscus sabdariffa]|uniref:Uncharacterized protein n=1 Tax=Hibiscus sabdariffa TaxID=183260 RepID=A0ABR2TT19_9ROSI
MVANPPTSSGKRRNVVIAMLFCFLDKVTWSVGSINSTARSYVRSRGLQLPRITPPAGRGVKLDQKDLATCRARGLAGPEALLHLQDAGLSLFGHIFYV